MSKNINAIVAKGVLQAIITLVPILDDATHRLHYDDDIVIDDLERPLERLLDDLSKLERATVELDKLQ